MLPEKNPFKYIPDIIYYNIPKISHPDNYDYVLNYLGKLDKDFDLINTISHKIFDLLIYISSTFIYWISSIINWLINWFSKPNLTAIITPTDIFFYLTHPYLIFKRICQLIDELVDKIDIALSYTWVPHFIVIADIEFYVAGLIMGVLYFIIIILPILLLIAFSTLAERKVMAGMQRRIGPNVVGIWGFLQPFADGLKLLIKEPIFPTKISGILFVLSPVLVLTLSLLIWFFLPIGKGPLSDFNLALLYILAVGVFEIYGIVFAGWSSNSKYALLGGLRSTAQMISYEIGLSFIFLSVVAITGSFSLTEIVKFQSKSVWLIMPLLPLAIIFLISMLAETNRTPFDLPEAEAELVAGYNVEYSSMLFALFFLGEYSNMLFLSGIFVTLFLGGWSIPVYGIVSSKLVLTVIMGVKLLLVFFFFIWIRATLPRYRYDQLMDLGWKVFLPFTFGYTIFIIFVLYFFNALPIYANIYLI